jgi:hypothetical protein
MQKAPKRYTKKGLKCNRFFAVGALLCKQIRNPVPVDNFGIAEVQF